MNFVLRTVLRLVVICSGASLAACQAPPEDMPNPALTSDGSRTVNAYTAVVENGRVTVKHEMVTAEQARWLRAARDARRAGRPMPGPVQQALISGSNSWSDCSQWNWTYFEGSGSFYCISYVSGSDFTGISLPFTPTYIDGSTSYKSALCSASSSCWVGECNGSNVVRVINIGEWIPSYSGGGTYAWIGPLVIC